MLKTVGFPSTRTGDQTIVNGNLIIGTAGKGIDFSANPNPGGMTSELLDDYEEGDWTATLIGSTAAPTTPVTVTAKYTKVGRQVTVFFQFDNVSTVGATGELRVTGLPFTVGSGGLGSAAAYGQGAAPFVCYPSPTTTYLRFYDMVTLSAININATATVFLYAQVTYTV
jgi:hypothetical protein